MDSDHRPVDPVAMGLRVRERRLKCGLSQTELANRVNMRQQGILNIEKGQVERPRLLREIAAALKTTQEWLLWKDGPEEVEDDQQAPDELLSLWKSAPPDRRRAVMRLLREPVRRVPKGRVA